MPSHQLLARASRVAALVGLLALVCACSPADDDAGATSAPGTTEQTTTTAPPPSTTSSLVTSDVQTEIDWVVSLLNGAETSAEEYDARFTDEFRGQVSYQTGFEPVLAQFRPAGPYTVVERTGTGASGEAVIEAADGTRLLLTAEIDDEGRFSTLLIQPAEPPTLEDPPGTVDEAFQRLAEMGTMRGMTAEIVDGECAAVDVMAAEEPAPLGSVFKLYVLGALGDAVLDGRVSWDDQIVITEDLMSIPGGELQDREPGSVVTVLGAAELMISISDNTAADLLIDMLGRTAVEKALDDYGNTSADLTIPFPTTREFAALKVGPAEGLRNPGWIEGDEMERRAILDQIADITPADLPLQEWTEPIDPDLVEWFASPEDLCALAIHLITLSAQVPEIADILEMNPGVPAADGTWDRIWFKGGSEPGLLAAWWVTEADGRTFFTTGSVVDPETTIDDAETVLLIAAARDLMAP